MALATATFSTAVTLSNKTVAQLLVDASCVVSPSGSTPDYSATFKIECTGSGTAGAAGPGIGGAAGAFARKNAATIAINDTFDLAVTAADFMDFTYFGVSGGALIVSAEDGGLEDAGIGGLASQCVGDVKKSGGNGGAAGAGGGGGGGGAGTAAADGENGTDGGAANGGGGGKDGDNVASGGNGGNTGIDGQSGRAVGGGGGGGGLAANGAAGIAGKVVFTFTILAAGGRAPSGRPSGARANQSRANFNRASGG